MSLVEKALFHAVRCASLPLGSFRSRGPLGSIHESLGRKAYPRPDSFSWFRNRWGHQFLLSYSYHIDRQMLIYGTYDRALHNAIEQRVKPGMVCMDVGANLGEMSLHMASKAGRRGLVYAFEPVPHVFQRVITHIARNGFGKNILAFAVALSDSNAPVQLAFTDQSADNQALGSIVNTHRAGLTRHIEVQGQTLDSFVVERGISRIDFMKVDIQGAEWLMLQGASDVLSRMQPELMLEISPSDLAEIGKDSRQLASLIESFGYQIYALERDGRPGRRLHAASLDPTFKASNVLCSKHAMA